MSEKVSVRILNQFRPSTHEEFTRDGDQYMRVRGVAAVAETVMNKQLYPANVVESMSKQAAGILAPISHPPEVEGKMLPAESAKALENGYAFTSVENASFEDGELRVSLVTNLSRSKGLELVDRYVDAVKNRKEIGLSTGGDGLAVIESGVKNKSAYDMRMIEADLNHIAILIGEDAAGKEFGTQIHNTKGEKMPEETKIKPSFDTPAMITQVISNALGKNINIGKHMQAMSANQHDPSALAAAIVNAFSSEEVINATVENFKKTLGFEIEEAKEMLAQKAEFTAFMNAKKAKRDELIKAAVQNSQGKTAADFESWPCEALEIHFKNDSKDDGINSIGEGGKPESENIDFLVN